MLAGVKIPHLRPFSDSCRGNGRAGCQSGNRSNTHYRICGERPLVLLPHSHRRPVSVATEDTTPKTLFRSLVIPTKQNLFLIIQSKRLCDCLPAGLSCLVSVVDPKVRLCPLVSSPFSYTPLTFYCPLPFRLDPLLLNSILSHFTLADPFF